MKKYALISVFNKEGVVVFAKGLEKLGWEIVSTGGTYGTLKKAGVRVTPIEKLTGNPEILDGGVKTISYQVAAGLLFDRERPEHARQMKQLEIKPIDLVVCNLYPFEETVSKKHSLKEAFEMIDIGGVTLLRAAAKNYNFVIALTDPKDYTGVLEELDKRGEVSTETRRELASKVFWKISEYDNVIDEYLAKELLENNVLKMSFCKGKKLRYGENPHLPGSFYKEVTKDSLALQNFESLQGKELSFNNILDVSAAVEALSEIGRKNPACVVIKHNSPAGAAVAETVERAYEVAWYGGDPLAAFGGVVAVNREVDKKLAANMLVRRGEKKFFEVLAAPGVTPEALKIFSKRKNLVILTNKGLVKPKLRRGFDYKFIRGGLLKQTFDSKEIKENDLRIVTKGGPTKKQIKDLLFAWSIVRLSKSNAVVIAKNQTLISSGVGQQDRKEACRIAVFKATDEARGKNKKTPIGMVAASDAFFPFADGPEILIKAGVKAIIQPGGSIRDQETIDLCDKYGVPMVFTGIRSFKH
jgi:phosphoribosylaminoimidazolecarboxamide formyltransferase/IMP cyclohydrolase